MAKVSGLAAHVGAGDQCQVVGAGVQRNVVRDEAGGLSLGKFLYNRVTPLDDAELAAFGHDRAHVAVNHSHFSQGRGQIELGHARCSLADSTGVGSGERADLVEDLFFQRDDPVLGRQYLAFQFL